MSDSRLDELESGLQHLLKVVKELKADGEQTLSRSPQHAVDPSQPPTRWGC